MEDQLQNKLNKIIELIKQEKLKSDNPSYDFLLTNLLAISSVEDIKRESKRLLFFLSDSYSGASNIEEQVGKFLLPYRPEKKKK